MQFFKNKPNPVHYYPAYSNKSENTVNAIIEINSMSINKYEIQSDSGILKLDRVGYSSLAYPFAYGEIPSTLDLDNDPLDIEIVNVFEPLQPGCLVEARIIGIMKFEDSSEIDDKVIAVLADDKRSAHIKSYLDLGEHFLKETAYYWEHYKDLKKPGTCKVLGFFDAVEASGIVDECIKRYEETIRPNLI